MKKKKNLTSRGIYLLQKPKKAKLLIICLMKKYQTRTSPMIIRERLNMMIIPLIATLKTMRGNYNTMKLFIITKRNIDINIELKNKNPYK